MLFHFFSVAIALGIVASVAAVWGLSTMTGPMFGPPDDYQAYGVTDRKSVRDALDATLQRLNLAFEQSFDQRHQAAASTSENEGLGPSSDPAPAKIPSLGIEIHVTESSWSGISVRSVSVPGHKANLRSIVCGMNDYFRRTKVHANPLSCITSFVVAVMFVLWLWYWVRLGLLPQGAGQGIQRDGVQELAGDDRRGAEADRRAD